MNLYRIFTGQGLFLTYITASSRAKALQQARHRYPDAVHADFARELPCAL